MELTTAVLLVFIPLFVSIDVLGNISLFVGLTEGYTEEHKKRLAWQAVVAAGIVGLIFGAVGNWIFSILGITPADFRVGGGLLLLALSLQDLLSVTDPVKPAAEANPTLGVVPLGVPLTIGPAALTTILIMQKTYGYLAVFVALFLNLLLVGTTFYWSSAVSRFIGPGTSRMIGKVVAILLAAIAVMMVRTGIFEILSLR